MKGLLRKHGQTIVNLFVFACLGRYVIDRGTDAALKAWFHHEFDFVAICFFLHNVVMVTLILVRRQHQAVDRNILHQAVALVAFFSGMAFVQTAPAALALRRASLLVTLAAIVLGTLTLFNLGRSFGILISVRKVQTTGFYGLMRHPMYFTDILWRVGFVLGNVGALNLAIFVASSACYVYRALLEEKFLKGYPEYREYMERVRYRFIPGVF